VFPIVGCTFSARGIGETFANGSPTSFQPLRSTPQGKVERQLSRVSTFSLIPSKSWISPPISELVTFSERGNDPIELWRNPSAFGNSSSRSATTLNRIPVWRTVGTWSSSQQLAPSRLAQSDLKITPFAHVVRMASKNALFRFVRGYTGLLQYT
jgi:hypothetical protein